MEGFGSLREYLSYIDSKGKLWRIKREINKDTELMPLVRWQFRGLPEEERRVFLFENVVDSRGRHYKIPVVVGMYAGSRQIYALCLKCSPDEIMDRWVKAQREPIEPVLVKDGPVHEEIHEGDTLTEHGGLDELPIPISTPGFDPAPFLTAAHWLTKDPETGLRNLGNYRGHVKSPLRTGICILPEQHLKAHWLRAKEMGRGLEAAVVIGGSPSYGHVAATKLPYGVDELAVAGALDNHPVELVRCKTLDLEVPANADIVLEGIIRTDVMEPEAPFGEFSGFVGERNLYPVFEIQCITHRKDAIYNAFISQFPPSESTKLKQMGNEAVYYKFLKDDCNISSIMDVVFHEHSGGSVMYVVIQLKKPKPWEVWQALNCAVGFSSAYGKIIIAVDEDINARDPDSVNWALCWRMQPHRDVRITQGKTAHTDPSASPPPEGMEEVMVYPPPTGTSSLLIDATLKWAYPPTSLPRREFMERARQIWEEEGLPELSPKLPWHGYSLGVWSEENEEEANLAASGEYYKTGEKLAGRRVPC
jgi:4-hydroxy-3-polyprenylbenzoate decarboxylase